MNDNQGVTMNNGDIVFGVVGTTTSLTLSQFNVALGCLAGLLTVCVMGLRLRKEWRNRDK